jgi:multimeric flavodoxin WrbA
MKITIIHGQNHIGSSCHIGRTLIEKLGTAANDVTEFFLPRDLNHFCLGCYSCIEKDTDCPYFEEKNRIMESIEASDLLIFTTPTYCMHASAAMKSFFELTFIHWMPHRPLSCMFSKKAVVISTAAGSGTKTAVKDIADFLNFWGISSIKKYGLAVQAANWEQVSDKKKAKIDTDMTKMARSIQKSKAHVGLKTKGLFSIMRLMQVKNAGSGEADRSYWEKHGWLGKARPWKSHT